ncbi:MAG: hypothetical protein K5793_03735 [Nitrosarchaeum sp.]|nr:hypothetical protein [Nitrosarchaeum sp.]
MLVEQVNKEQKFATDFIHCSQNRTKVKFLIRCWKCKKVSKGKTRGFDNCRSAYYHLTHHHSGMDRNSYPTRDQCIEYLQKISDMVQVGVLQVA